MATPILSVNGLRKAYGGVVAVDGVSFELEQGHMLAIIGPNGAGKSTCFNMLGGQIRPDSGSIAMGGHEVSRRTPQDIWRLGTARTFQITATFVSMTVRENVQMVLLARDRRLARFWSPASSYAPEEAERLLNLVGMRGQSERICGTLAYGDLKRVELAMALASGPKILLMDEPTAGMAPLERIALMDLVRSLVSREGLSVLFTEHDMDVVFGHADHIVVLNRGRIIASGGAEEIRANSAVQDVYLGGGTMYGAH
ncbi:MAG: ABC transporter ATP-binding protein [Rhodospirillales bacterium SCN 65-16]|nr:MAG: ABC transporter ATP-binding protein [Rhodospirillales bacterium SCN 65-16]